MFSILENLQKNMLYVTYKTDAIIKLLKSLETDNRLQKSVDAYFEDNAEDIPEEKQEDGTRSDT